MRSQLLSEISRSGRRRWLQVDEMPFSRAITYKLIDAELISSLVVTWPGSRRGRRLIDGDSLDSYLESLTAKQAAVHRVPIRQLRQVVKRGTRRRLIRPASSHPDHDILMLDGQQVARFGSLPKAVAAIPPGLPLFYGAWRP